MITFKIGLFKLSGIDQETHKHAMQKKGILTPIYTKLEGGGAPKKKLDFLVKFFQKVLKTPFLACIFSRKKMTALQKNW